jgi:hypothetical protein
MGGSEAYWIAAQTVQDFLATIHNRKMLTHADSCTDVYNEAHTSLPQMKYVGSGAVFSPLL